MKYDDVFVEGDEDMAPIKNLSMKLWGNAGEKVLKILREDEELKHATALSGIGIKHSSGLEDFVISDITFQGKFTARGGTSIDGHFHLVKKTQEAYGIFE